MANQVLYGFHNIRDIFDRQVSDVQIGVLNDAVDATVAEYNRFSGALLDLFCDRTTDYKRMFRSPVMMRNQPIDEVGRALPTKGYSRYEIAFPYHRSAQAWGWDYETRLRMTVQDVNNHLDAMLMGDQVWIRDHILAALYANASWTFTDDDHGALTIQGLANNDAVQYQLMTGADTGATDNHYFAQAAAIADGANPFPTIYQELTEHPENAGGQVVALVPTNLKASVQALTNFFDRQDPNLAPGSGVTQLVGNLGIATPGELIGYESSGVWIVEWRQLPNDYIVAVNTAGPRPLVMREPEIAALRGFNFVAERSDFPYWERQYRRYAGFGAQNRVGALVYRIGNASYAVPTGYSSPMP
jgi:hypothetical protein